MILQVDVGPAADQKLSHLQIASGHCPMQQMVKVCQTGYFGLVFSLIEGGRIKKLLELELVAFIYGESGHIVLYFEIEQIL